MVKRKIRHRPLYVQIERRLIKAIESNKYPVGGLLPTEDELCAQFGAGRSTIREAIRRLRVQGILSAKRGVGTRVEARNAQASYVQSLELLMDAVRYADQTVLEGAVICDRTVDARLAQKLGVSTGSTWVQVKGLRRWRHIDRVAAWTDIYFDKALGNVARDAALPSNTKPRFRQPVAKIQQDVEATVLTKEQASLLGVSENCPALLITRRFIGPDARLVEVTFNVHPLNAPDIGSGPHR